MDPRVSSGGRAHGNPELEAFDRSRQAAIGRSAAPPPTATAAQWSHSAIAPFLGEPPLPVDRRSAASTVNAPKERSSLASWLGGSLSPKVAVLAISLALVAGSARAVDNPPPVTAEQELVQKVIALVHRDYDGDYRKAFDHYANADGVVDRDRLCDFLKDAGIGSLLTRGLWVSGIIERFDKPPRGHDVGGIDWQEFEAARTSVSQSR